ncbi:hypothetical protein TREMEDRAFT_66592 [Tremella mesenterica DSM 1558]|uniref:uncharacterized protein n=1 Tax=Tremella mesenterica (strain ATCC 24925 / CBS 8224 / DSM 1558 / NBRC 9311 / NRRL Y-6157 / RJB 2259-6 / UBC 559-6) TaxID=578456 RepID=UPI00032C8AA3|nr:uncharacterized protein TREMEDRAFT_66592 [Tremella mesenterica DSM 1558]EIW65428.1 hypothetical protein TREMEDRAFT_66592 [Tremella mesenterica DSM 1558]
MTTDTAPICQTRGTKRKYQDNEGSPHNEDTQLPEGDGSQYNSEDEESQEGASGPTEQLRTLKFEDGSQSADDWIVCGHQPDDEDNEDVEVICILQEDLSIRPPTWTDLRQGQVRAKHSVKAHYEAWLKYVRDTAGDVQLWSCTVQNTPFGPSQRSVHLRR